MKVARRRGVTPAATTMLLLVISGVSGMTTFFFVSNLAGSPGGASSQRTPDLITLDAYSFATNPPSAASPVTLVFVNSGEGAVTISGVYFDGSPLTLAGGPALDMFARGTVTLALSTSASPVGAGFNGVPAGLGDGTTHQVKVVTTGGAAFTFTVLAGVAG